MVAIESTFIRAMVRQEKAIRALVWKKLEILEKDRTAGGLNLEKLKNANGLYSIRINRDIRVILLPDAPPGFSS